MHNPILQLKEVRFRWPKQSTDLLYIPHLSIQKGQHLFIQGPSGSGKTTLLNLLTGINVPQSGSVTILSNNLVQLSNMQRDQFRADHLGVIFQQFNLLPYLSLVENVLLPCGFSKRKKANASDLQVTARDLLHQLNIPTDLFNKPVAQLSVGQQQRAAVARALIGNPEIVIADEPTSALDSNNRDRFLELLFQEADIHGSTLIFVSHDAQLAERFPRLVSLPELNQAPVLST